MPFAELIPNAPSKPPPSDPIGPGKITPFMSYSWCGYAGRYGQTLVMIDRDARGAGTIGAIKLLGNPKGRRVAVFNGVEGDLFHYRDDRLQGKFLSLWWTKGVAARKVVTQRIVDEMAAKGTTLDLAVFDIESGLNCWNLGPEDLAAIYADPRYAALVATGDFPADCRNLSEADRMHFNYGCAKLVSAAIYEAVVVPIRSRFPNVDYSNWLDSPITKADAPFVPEFNGHVAYYAPSGATYYAPVFYGYIAQLGLRDARFKEPWYCMALYLNTVRAAYRADPRAKIMPWVAPASMANALDPDHWQEMIFQLCCLCGPRLFYFNAVDFKPLTNWQFDHAISQFVGQCGGTVWERTLVTDLMDYDKSTFAVSAARLADGSTLGRVTFKTGVNTATVTLDGRSVTLDRTAGSVGAWFRFASND